MADPIHNKPSPSPPLTRIQLQSARSQLFDIFDEWDGLIECEMDADGWPVGDSDQANMKRMVTDVTSRTSRLIFNLSMRGMEAAPPIPIEEFKPDDDA